MDSEGCALEDDKTRNFLVVVMVPTFFLSMLLMLIAFLPEDPYPWHTEHDNIKTESKRSLQEFAE